MPRCDEDDVRAVIELAEGTNVLPFIEQATALVDHIVSKNPGILSTALAKRIEINLAAHYTEFLDRQYDSNSTLGSSATYQGKTAMGFDSTKWGQAAKGLDVTGTLVNLDKKDRPKIGLYWLGKNKRDQIDAVDRHGE